MKPSALAGPKEAYPPPDCLKKLKFILVVQLLDDYGHPLRGDSHMAYTQIVPLALANETNDGLFSYVGQSSKGVHPEQNIDMVRHNTGLSFTVVNVNANELLSSHNLFRSSMDEAQRKQLFSQPSTEIQIMGDCPETNSDEDEMELNVSLNKTKHKTTLAQVCFQIKKAYLQEWVDKCFY